MFCRNAAKYILELKGVHPYFPDGSIMRPAERHSTNQKKMNRPRMLSHFVPSWRLSPADLLAANGFEKLFTACK